MSEFGVKKSLSQITGTLEYTVEAIKMHRDVNTFKETSDSSNSYPCSIIDAIPSVPTCFDSGLAVVSSFRPILQALDPGLTLPAAPRRTFWCPIQRIDGY